MSRIAPRSTSQFIAPVIPSKLARASRAPVAPTAPRRSLDVFEAKGHAKVTPGSISLGGDAQVRGSIDAGGAKVSGGISVKGEVVAESIDAGDGMTGWAISGSAEVNADGQASGAGGSVGGSVKVAVKARYEVRVPTDKMGEVQNKADVNPWNPDSMPVGTVITLDGSVSGEVGANGSAKRKVGPISAELAAELKLSAAEEVAVVVEKTGPQKVKVTVGPKSSLDVEGRVSVKAEIPGIGEVGVSVGGEYHQEHAATRTAEFDLSSPEGKAAYEHFLATGELPRQNGPGVSGCESVEVTKTSSEWEASVSALGEKLTLFGDDASSSTKVTTHADGSKDVELKVRRDSDDLTLIVERSYGPDGQEDVSKRKTRYETKVTPENEEALEEMLEKAYGQKVDLKPGQTVRISVDANQEKQLAETVERARREGRWALQDPFELDVTLASLVLRDTVQIPGKGEEPVIAMDPRATTRIADFLEETLPGVVEVV